MIGRIENPSCSACRHPSQDTSHLILHCPATDFLRHSLFGDFLSLRPLVQALGSCPASGAPWSFAMPPFFGRGRVAATTKVGRCYPKLNVLEQPMLQTWFVSTFLSFIVAIQNCYNARTAKVFDCREQPTAIILTVRLLGFNFRSKRSNCVIY